MTTTLQTPPPLKHEILGSISEIIRTVDEHARDVNRRWGFNRLPHLVPIEWTERFVAQKRKWELACFECVGSLAPEDLDGVRRHGEAMIRAFAALERTAVENGNLPGPAQHWEFQLRDGTPVILVRDRAEMGQVQPDERAVQIWSLEEISDIVAKFPELIRCKDALPGAELVELKTSARVWDKLDDEMAEVPF